jgi:hypothetical protein
MPAKARVRMYRQGLGDCFLVTFQTDEGARHVLIDCGTLGATTTGVGMDQVIENIVQESGRTLHLLVATHEHKDHVSGFNSQQERFDELEVERSWTAWTEKASDAVAQEIAKYEEDLLLGLTLATEVLAKAAPATPAETEMVRELDSGTRALLGFLGDLPNEGEPFSADFAKTVHAGMSYATTRGKENQFLYPGTLIEEPWLPGIRIYVLGPPRDAKKLRQMGEHGSADLYGLSAGFASDLSFCARFSASDLELDGFWASLPTKEQPQFEKTFPFDPRFRVEGNAEALQHRFGSYYDGDEAWRRIDFDWLAGASDLALQLDSYTNNTSLVLAFELVEDGRVLLFPADAQLGNWLSWKDYTWKVPQPDGTIREVKARDLLSRTVFYKVGHHASHNATASVEGLELMLRDDLVAAIPVDRQVALNKQPPWLMPADALYERLLEKTSGRVLRSDTGWPEPELRPCSISTGDWDQARQKAPVTVNELYIDFIF